MVDSRIPRGAVIIRDNDPVNIRDISTIMLWNIGDRFSINLSKSNFLPIATITGYARKING